MKRDLTDGLIFFFRAIMRDMQQRIGRAVELARTAGNVRSADWLTRVLGFEPEAVAVPMDELTVFTAAEYLARSSSSLQFLITIILLTKY